MQRLFLLVALSGLVEFSSGAAHLPGTPAFEAAIPPCSVVPDDLKVTAITGYISDNQCIDAATKDPAWKAPDKSLPLANPSTHLAWCIFNIPSCAESGFSVLQAPVTPVLGSGSGLSPSAPHTRAFHLDKISDGRMVEAGERHIRNGGKDEALTATVVGFAGKTSEGTPVLQCAVVIEGSSSNKIRGPQTIVSVEVDICDEDLTMSGKIYSELVISDPGIRHWFTNDAFLVAETVVPGGGSTTTTTTTTTTDEPEEPEEPEVFAPITTAVPTTETEETFGSITESSNNATNSSNATNSTLTASRRRRLLDTHMPKECTKKRQTVHVLYGVGNTPVLSAKALAAAINGPAPKVLPKDRTATVTFSVEGDFSKMNEAEREDFKGEVRGKFVDDDKNIVEADITVTLAAGLSTATRSRRADTILVTVKIKTTEDGFSATEFNKKMEAGGLTFTYYVGGDKKTVTVTEFSANVMKTPSASAAQLSSLAAMLFFAATALQFC